jgi:hypothetical protein
LSGNNPLGWYCPDWCHTWTPPYYDTLSRPWVLEHVAGDSLTVTATPASELTIDVPADIPRDGSVAYEGKTIAKSGSGHLALIGCVTEHATSAKYAVVHEWDGTTLGQGRRLPATVACTEQVYPLVDGTWVFASDAQGGVVLVRP